MVSHGHKVLVSQNASGNTNRIDTDDVGFTGEGGDTIYILRNDDGTGQRMIETSGSSATDANLPPYLALLACIKY